jgi:riboflavin biosynthesis pyrimidine reductase
VVHALAERDLVDEYRILFFSSALGAGTRLFAAEGTPAHFHLASAETSGQEILARYERPDS